jgi:hypothetical protein
MSSRVVRAWVVLVRRGYRTMVASMVSLRAGRIVAELACSPLRDRGAKRSGRRPWQTDPRRRSTGHPGDHGAARLARPVSRDRVTPLCCGRGGVTRSFSCRSAGGGDGTGSSTGHTGHRPTAISMVRRRAELARLRLPGPVCHMPGGPGARHGTARFASRLARARRTPHAPSGQLATAAPPSPAAGRDRKDTDVPSVLPWPPASLAARRRSRCAASARGVMPDSAERAENPLP